METGRHSKFQALISLKTVSEDAIVARMPYTIKHPSLAAASSLS